MRQRDASDLDRAERDRLVNSVRIWAKPQVDPGAAVVSVTVTPVTPYVSGPWRITTEYSDGSVMILEPCE